MKNHPPRLLPVFLAMILLPSGSARLAADDADWKLQPLPYNHPGLKVDLGVGLWAWPMPMDYDGDGDMDLLVACPDKPSNGVYFFENPTQDPKVKRPVFKPGVRLGNASQNMQVSYVNGEPRILAPGLEHVDFRKSKFANPKKIYPKANIHENGVRANMWRYVDHDGDGDQDLIVGVGDWTDYGWDHAYDSQGRWRNGPLHGYVYLIQNDGSDAEPKYSDDPEMLRAGGGEIDVYGWPSPNFADFDGDGDLDLLCGEFLDGFTYFENLGTREEPDYGAGRKLDADDGRPLTMDLEMITPTAFDWDGDGDLDLIVGDEDGRVALIENLGKLDGGRPVFSQPVYFQQEADTLKFGALATPFAYDWDGDGDEDILCGNTAGYIGLIENLGNGEGGLPKWAAPKRLEVEGKEFRIMAGSNGSIQGPCEAKWGYTTLSVADWNGDGFPDVLLNSILGVPQFLLSNRSDGGAGSGNLGLNSTYVDCGLLGAYRAALYPAFWEALEGQSTEKAPFGPDGSNRIEFLKRRPELLEHLSRLDLRACPKWSWESPPNDFLRTQWRTTPVQFDGATIVGLDSEGYLSKSTRRPAPSALERGPFERLFIDEDNAPLRLNGKSCGSSGRVKLAVVDWDGDGRLDVLTNSENATWYRNCEDRDGKIVMKRIGNLAKRNVAGHTSSPAACDFDKDGKPDLLVGAENGRIYHIRHDDCLAYPADQLKARPPKPKAEPRFPGFIGEDFVFTKASFPQCHASTICETTRGLVIAWFGGTKEKDEDVGIWVSYHDGAGWSSPKEWANGVQFSGKRHPCWNPVLHQPPGDAPTLLFFKVGPDPAHWWGEMMVSYDRGRTFRERRRLPEGIDGPVRCKPILLPDGETLLCGSSTEYDGWRVHFEKTRLFDGQPAGTWERIGPINTKEEFNAIQPTFLRHADGTLQVLCRTRESVITTSFSKDDGKTWSKMEATNLPNPNSGIENVTLTDGRHLLIYNHLGSAKNGWGRRGMLNLAISEDGREWRKVAVLEQEEKAEFSYPAIIQTEDGLVHMSYTWKRQRIKHVVVDPEKIETGDVLSLENW
ncbi:MAG: exo-alpha-sialidase [Verrucomicrobiae bacterium]|nr:exo-alpha-sialidase [Verrucomicrobiae bacterium]